MEVDLSSGSSLEFEEMIFELGWPRELSHNKPVIPRGAGGAVGAVDAMGAVGVVGAEVARGAPPDFGRSINPISTRGSRLCPPNNTGTPGFSNLPMALHNKSDLDCLTD